MPYAVKFMSRTPCRFIDGVGCSGVFELCVWEYVLIVFIIDNALDLGGKSPSECEGVGYDCNFEVRIFAEHKCGQEDGSPEAFTVLWRDGDDKSLNGPFGKFLEELVIGLVKGRPVELWVYGRGECLDGAFGPFGRRLFQFDEGFFVCLDAVFAGCFLGVRLVFGVVSGHGWES